MYMNTISYTLLSDLIALTVYIGYDNFKIDLIIIIPTKNVDYLHHDGFYQVCKEDIDFTEVDVHNHDGDYIFQLTKYGDTKVLSKENFGKYISDKVISDLKVTNVYYISIGSQALI